ncbi:MAG TPA: hypothetical protein VGC30_13810 [Dokdonella sp.]
MTTLPIRRFAFAAVLAACAAASSARADPLTLAGTSAPTTYARGRTNSYLLDLYVISPNFGGADALYFTLPAGVTLSAVRLRNTFSWCSDIHLAVMGMGSSEGGWYALSYPVQDGCGYFSGMGDPGMEQIVIVDVDVPADYAGDLPLVVNALGDGIDDPPYQSALTLTMTDDGSVPRSWDFDAAAAPALPAGWTTTSAGAGVAWATQAGAAASGANAAYAPTRDAAGESVLTAPAIAIPPGASELQFRQRYASEASRDGGVLEIAIDDGAYEDVVDAGGTFALGGYTGALDASDCTDDTNPLAGRASWTGVQAAFAPVTVALPAAAAGHQARFRWRLGTDCAGASDASNGWWIDDVRVVPAAPKLALPAKLAVRVEGGASWSEPLAIGNDGGGTLGYAVTAAAATGDDPAADCATPSAAPGWLHVDGGSGVLAGGERTRIAVGFDAAALAAGDYAGVLCVASDDAAAPLSAIPVRLSVAAAACAAPDRIFANGFDDDGTGSCGAALRTYDDRTAFLAAVAPGYHEDDFDGLRDGYVNGPLYFGGDGYRYAVTALPQRPDASDMYLFAGSGVLSTVAAGADSQLTITFSGVPVTALGGRFWGQMFLDISQIEMNLQPETTIVLTLDDGTTESFVATSQQDFRGFVATKPITSLTVAAPEPTTIGYSGYVWGVFDDLIVGRAN